MTTRSTGSGNCSQAHRVALSSLTGALGDILRELEMVVGGMTASQYIEPCGASFCNGTVGAHVRHCLDHIRAVVDGRLAGCIDYDQRERGTSIETDAGAAAVELRRLRNGVSRLTNASPAEPVVVAIMPTHDGGKIRVQSTLARELAFILSHTIHHNAMVRGMATLLGAHVPSTFGYAPSTRHHLESVACVR